MDACMVNKYTSMLYNNGASYFRTSKTVVLLAKFMMCIRFSAMNGMKIVL